VYEVSQFAPSRVSSPIPTLLAVPASAPWKNLADFVDDAKKRPGEIPLRFVGPIRHAACAMEIFAASAGIKNCFTSLPRRRACAQCDPDWNGAWPRLGTRHVKQQVDDGKMRVLAKGRRADRKLSRSADVS